MVITNVIGGLGNQMFQYAAGRALSLERGVSLRLDVSRFASYELHQGFELERLFKCKAGIANETDMRNIFGLQFSPIIRKILSRPSLAIFRCKGFVIEPHYHYWKGVKDSPADCYLAGYWQSEKYFLEVDKQIRDDFSFKLPLDVENSEWAKKIGQTNSVSLNVRRGDYVGDSRNLKKYKLCSIDYYREAIRYIVERIENPHFFIFSDDMAWVKSNLKINFPYSYVDCNHGENSANDMRLMSLCRHNIIANSSFSWWGAWLNKNSEKIIIAPEHWFNNNFAMTKDLYPSGWVSL